MCCVVLTALEGAACAPTGGTQPDPELQRWLPASRPPGSRLEDTLHSPLSAGWWGVSRAAAQKGRRRKGALATSSHCFAKL